MSPATDRPSLAFVTGRGRSGTWLLQAILNRHPRIRLAPEGEILILLGRRYGDVGPWTPEVRVRFCRDLRTIPRLTRWWGLDLDVVEERIVERHEGGSFEDMCRLLYASHARVAEGADGKDDGEIPSVLGEKNPGYALMLPSLLTRFPDARVVHMVRDPRDNVLSFQGVEFDLDGTAALAERWRRYAEAGLAAREAFPARVHLVRFEDLVRKPAPTLDGICRFLGVEPDPELLSFHEDPGAPVLPWNERIGSPLDPDRLGRWRNAISDPDRRLVEARCGPAMERLGYEPAAPPPGVLDRLRALPGTIVGGAATGLERAFARVPLPVQMAVLARYRSWDEGAGRRPPAREGAS